MTFHIFLIFSKELEEFKLSSQLQTTFFCQYRMQSGVSPNFCFTLLFTEPERCHVSALPRIVLCVGAFTQNQIPVNVSSNLQYCMDIETVLQKYLQVAKLFNGLVLLLTRGDKL